MKLYEKVLRKLGWWADPPAPESKLYNPINAKVGSGVSLDVLDHRGLNYVVKEVRENSVVGAQSFVDYTLTARPVTGADVWVRLRAVPDGDALRVLLLEKYDDLAYDEGLHNTCKDESGKFVVDDEATGHDEFWRINDVLTSYRSEVENVSEVGTERRSVEFWDYSRLTTIDGVEKEQFLFAEMDGDNGWFQIWRGAEIGADKVSVY